MTNVSTLTTHTSSFFGFCDHVMLFPGLFYFLQIRHFAPHTATWHPLGGPSSTRWESDPSSSVPSTPYASSPGRRSSAFHPIRCSASSALCSRCVLDGHTLSAPQIRCCEASASVAPHTIEIFTLSFSCRRWRWAKVNWYPRRTSSPRCRREKNQRQRIRQPQTPIAMEPTISGARGPPSAAPMSVKHKPPIKASKSRKIQVQMLHLAQHMDLPRNCVCEHCPSKALDRSISVSRRNGWKESISCLSQT
jgi:hypothetical protein